MILLWITGSTTLRNADGIHLPQLLLNSNASQIVTNVINSSSHLINTQSAEDNFINNFSPGFFSKMDYYVKPKCTFNSTCKYGLLNYFQVNNFFLFYTN